MSYGQDAPASPIKVDTVTEMSISATTDLMGTLHSRSHVQITAGVSGRIDWIAEPGTYLQKDDVMVKMDLLPLQLMQAEQLAQIKRAEINMRYLKNEAGRLQKLRKTNATSQFQLDQTKSQFDLASADIEIANLKLQQVEDKLTRATIKAPFDGVVTERIVLADTDVDRSDILLKLLDTENLEVRVYVPIKYLAFIRKGDELTLNAVGQSLSTKISVVIPSADARSQTFEVRIRLPEQMNEKWAAGQLVKVTVPIQDATPSLTVHRDALILRKEGTFIIKIGPDSKAHRLKVSVGKGTTERVSISGNIFDGDKVAIRGAERLKDGQLVVVQ
jgi:RND family efflux transporter MFP subunit